MILEKVRVSQQKNILMPIVKAVNESCKIVIEALEKNYSEEFSKQEQRYIYIGEETLNKIKKKQKEMRRLQLLKYKQTIACNLDPSQIAKDKDSITTYVKSVVSNDRYVGRVKILKVCVYVKRSEKISTLIRYKTYNIYIEN